MYEIYCDGSCKSNGTSEAKAAYGFILYEITPTSKIELYRESGPVEGKATNNVAELTALLKSLQYWKATYGDTVIVHCDSAYIVNCYKNKWIDNWKRNGWMTANRKPVKNKELWMQIDEFFSDHRNVILDKVEGHAGIEGNELVDKMAQGVWTK